MTIIEAVRILVENKSTIIWEEEDTAIRAMRFNAAIDTVAEHFTPVEIEMEGGGSTWWYVCEDCHGAVDENDLYCKHCGRPLKK